MGLVFTKNRLTTAVLLCAGHNEGLGLLVKDTPECMMPVLNRPFIEYTIEFLKSKGFKSIIVSVPIDGNRTVPLFLNELGRRHAKIKIDCIEEEKPKGTAGALRDMKDLIGQESFLVLNGNTFLADIDFDSMLAEHVSKRSVVTIGVKKTLKTTTEGINISEDGIVKGFSVIHPSRDRRSPYSASGVYIFDEAALEFINGKGYFDIKEQLIPALQNVSLPVRIYELEGYCRPVATIEDYFAAHREVLFRWAGSRGMTEIAEGVWAGENANISSRAFVLGPVIIGDNCTIGESAQIIGPAVIGNNCSIGKRAKVRESVIWNDLELEDGATIRHCIAGSGVRVYAGDTLDNKILVDYLRPSDVNLMPTQYEFNGLMESVARRMGGARYKIFLGIKRLVDLTAAAMLLILLSPLIIGLSIIIKLDSDGPSVFRQRRCGRHGKDFVMYKFRTMVKDASALQQTLASKSNVDGPMFKLQKDPRITRIGGFLRKTSLDELPQLFNVLKGDMSLVGPRPLVMDEMKFSPSWRNIRLRVKPGITGLWQVEGRSEASFQDWIRHDVFYVKKQSLFLDLKILFKTMKVVLNKVGAY